MTDITELVQRMKEHAGYIIDLLTHEPENEEAIIHAYDQADRIFSAENVLVLVEALESEKRICSTWRKTSEANSKKLEKAQAKADVYDTLRDDYCLREKGVGLADFVDWQAKRISDLESCTVKLPLPACTYADHSYPAYTKQQVLSLLESLGVTVVEEDV